MKDADTDKKKKILKKVAELIVKIFNEGVGINTGEDQESVENADKSEEDEKEDDVDNEAAEADSSNNDSVNN